MTNTTIPEKWNGVKIDLFHNYSKRTGELEPKLKLSIITKEGRSQPIIAALGSPRRYVWRGVTDSERQQPHWQVVEKTYDILKKNKVDFRASKCTLPNNEQRTDKVVFLFEDDTEWTVCLINEGETFYYSLPKDYKKTVKQRNTNIVSSIYVAKNPTKWADCEALGI